ncbi:hypothetical protein Trisim1_006007 [Trichoderma cf. simile WF8]
MPSLLNSGRRHCPDDATAVEGRELKKGRAPEEGEGAAVDSGPDESCIPRADKLLVPDSVPEEEEVAGGRRGRRRKKRSPEEEEVAGGRQTLGETQDRRKGKALDESGLPRADKLIVPDSRRRCRRKGKVPEEEEVAGGRRQTLGETQDRRKGKVPEEGEGAAVDSGPDKSCILRADKLVIPDSVPEEEEVAGGRRGRRRKKTET